MEGCNSYVMNHNTGTLFFYFLFLEWIYIIRYVTLMSHDHHGKVVHRPSRIGINSVLKSSRNSNKCQELPIPLS